MKRFALFPSLRSAQALFRVKQRLLCTFTFSCLCLLLAAIAIHSLYPQVSHAVEKTESKEKKAENPDKEANVRIYSKWEILEVMESDKGSEIQISQSQAAEPEIKRINIPYFELKYLYTLKGDPESAPVPYLVFTGKTCRNCNEIPFVLLVHARSGKTAQFVYPGIVKDTAGQSTLMSSRAFYGKCLSIRKHDVYVVFLREHIRNKRRLWRSVALTEPGSDYLKEQLIEYRLPNINTTLQRVRSGQCHEIEGMTRRAKKTFQPAIAPPRTSKSNSQRP